MRVTVVQSKSGLEVSLGFLFQQTNRMLWPSFKLLNSSAQRMLNNSWRTSIIWISKNTRSSALTREQRSQPVGTLVPVGESRIGSSLDNISTGTQYTVHFASAHTSNTPANNSSTHTQHEFNPKRTKCSRILLNQAAVYSNPINNQTDPREYELTCNVSTSFELM